MPQITLTDRFGVSWTWTSNKLKPLVKPKKTEHPVKPERKASVGRVQETVKRMNSLKKHNTHIGVGPCSVYLTVPDAGNLSRTSSEEDVSKPRERSSSVANPTSMKKSCELVSYTDIESRMPRSPSKEYLGVENKLKKSSSKLSLSGNKNSLFNLFKRNKSGKD